MASNSTITKTGAAELADRIVEYWTDRGFPGIRAWVDKIRARGVNEDGTPQYWLPNFVFCVRTNIGPDGYPPLAKA